MYSLPISIAITLFIIPGNIWGLGFMDLIRVLCRKLHPSGPKNIWVLGCMFCWQGVLNSESSSITFKAMLLAS